MNYKTLSLVVSRESQIFVEVTSQTKLVRARVENYDILFLSKACYYYNQTVLVKV